MGEVHRKARATIGRFTVTRKIGSGGQGSVYLAEDPQLKRALAIKLIDNAMQMLSAFDAATKARDSLQAANDDLPKEPLNSCCGVCSGARTSRRYRVRWLKLAA